jgi:hypothetical protein
VDQRLDEDVLSAWISKIEQSYRKAKIMLRERQDLDLVEATYIEALEKIRLCGKEKTDSLPKEDPVLKSEIEAKADVKAHAKQSKKTDMTVWEILMAISLVSLLIALVGGIFGIIDATDQNALLEQVKQMTYVEGIQETSETLSIEPGAVYTYGYKMNNLYVATAVSSTVIKVERWTKDNLDDSDYEKKYDLGVYQITDSENGFCWLDAEHTAFRMVIEDKNNVRKNGSEETIFTELPNEADQGMGTNYVTTLLHYEYRYNDNYLYIAVPLSDDLIKIECWYKRWPEKWHSYCYDVYTVDLNNEFSNIDFIESEHATFTATIMDAKNSNMKEPIFVLFEEGPWG